MPRIKAVVGRCPECGKRFYAPYGMDGEPLGVALEGNRVGCEGCGWPCRTCRKIIWERGGPVWWKVWQ